MSVTMECPTPPLSFDPSKGISTTSLTPDSTTGRVSAAQVDSYIESLRSSGNLPRAASYETPVPGDLADKINIDAKSYSAIQTEYCYYEAQYKTALSSYLNDATSTDTSLNQVAKTKLAGVTQLNLRLNSLLEIMNSLSQERATNVESNKKSINKWNEDISKKLSGLQNQYNRITKDDKTVLRQTSMVEFSKEKNIATSNQIGLYIALNIAAIGMIFFVSRSL